MKRWRRRDVLAASAAAAIGSVTPRVLAGEAELKPFLGTYEHAGGEKDREARDKAIDDVVKEMNPIARGIARDRLTDANPIAAKIVIASDGKKVTISQDGRSYTAPLDGTAVKVKGITGDELSLKVEVTADELRQVFWADDRGRTNRFRVDGKKLVMHVRVHSTKLPKDVVYKLVYAAG